jgi:hypothetical protein
LKEQLGDAKFEQSIESYNGTDQSRQYAQEDFGSEAAAQDFLNRQGGGTSQSTTQPDTQSTTQSSAKTTLDPLSWLLQSTLKGAL